MSGTMLRLELDSILSEPLLLGAIVKKSFLLGESGRLNDVDSAIVQSMDNPELFLHFLTQIDDKDVEKCILLTKNLVKSDDFLDKKIILKSPPNKLPKVSQQKFYFIDDPSLSADRNIVKRICLHDLLLKKFDSKQTTFGIVSAKINDYINTS